MIKLLPYRRWCFHNPLCRRVLRLRRLHRPDPKVGDGYAAKFSGAASVIPDPAVTVHTPEWLWFPPASGAVDHAVEGTVLGGTVTAGGSCVPARLRLLGPSLARSEDPDPADMKPARMPARAWLLRLRWHPACPNGASHGIGYSLGAVTGMSHGYTSCVMRRTMRWNYDVTRDAQTRIA